MNGCRNVLTNSLIFLGSVLVLTSVLSSTAWAQPKLANLEMVRLLENQDVLTTVDEVPSLDEGVAFPPGGRSVIKLVPEQAAGRPAEAANVILLTGNPRTPAMFEVTDPINITSDPTTNAPFLLVYEPENRELTLIIRTPHGDLDPNSIANADAARVNIENPQGMTFDGRTLYVLDGKELVKVKTGRLRAGPAFPRAVKRAKIERLDLSTVVDGGRPRGIAFNPQNSHLYLFHPGTEEIIELTTNGTLVDRREVDLDLTDLKGCIFARSSDGTDQPSLFNLFIATGGSPSGEVTEWSLN